MNLKQRSNIIFIAFLIVTAMWVAPLFVPLSGQLDFLGIPVVTAWLFAALSSYLVLAILGYVFVFSKWTAEGDDK